MNGHGDPVTTLRRTTSLALLTAVIVGLLAAAPASAAWKKTLTWKGAVTQACRAPQADGDLRVKVRLNNRDGKAGSTGGLNRVRADGSTGNAWTYTRHVRPGKISNVVSLDFARGSKVYLLIGSDVGITGERIIKVSALPRC